MEDNRIFDISAAADTCIKKLYQTSRRLKTQIPYTARNNRYEDYSSHITWWTNGFWPGILWLAYQKTGDAWFRYLAEETEEKLDDALKNWQELHHDVGFMWHISAGANYQLTGNETSKNRAMFAAALLASRFNPQGEFIRAWNSWGEGSQDNTGWAIIDCMMNLPLLYWASEETKDARFANIAIKHAQTVLRHFISPDGSVRHIVSFDPVTGKFKESLTGQGYSPDSAWSRGVSWAIYGFALSAKYTGRTDFLEASQKTADYFCRNLPDDLVPGADFKAPKDMKNPKDSSAAAIAGAGMLLLSGLLRNQAAGFRNQAISILKSLHQNYMGSEGQEPLLLHGCTAFHTDEENRDIPLIYGDYFYLEALLMAEGRKGLF